MTEGPGIADILCLRSMRNQRGGVFMCNPCLSIRLGFEANKA